MRTIESPKAPLFALAKAVRENHADDCKSGNAFLLTGKLPTLAPESVRPRKDMCKNPASIIDGLTDLLRGIAVEAELMQKKVWGPGRPNEFRTQFADGYDLVVRITDAASGHTTKTFSHDGENYSGMMMVWFTIEKSRISTADYSDHSVEPQITEDEASPSGVSFFSNKELLTQYSTLPLEVKELLATSLGIAVGFLQDKLGIANENIGKEMDISMGVGSRLFSESLTGRQPTASQSGAWGHIVAVYHDDNERDTSKMALKAASREQMIKVMDPWIEVITEQFGPEMLTVAQHAINQEPNLSASGVELTQVWDGFDMKFPNAVDITTAYFVSSVIYTRFADIHKESVQYFKVFLTQSENDTNNERSTFQAKLKRFGLSQVAASAYISFIEKLQPSRALLAEIRQNIQVVDQKKDELLLSFENKTKEYNSNYRRVKRAKLREKQDLYLQSLKSKLEGLIQKPYKNNRIYKRINNLKKRIVSYQKHVLMATIIGQRFLDPMVGAKPVPKADVETKETLATIIPLDTFNAVNLIKDFSYDSVAGKIKVSTQRLSFTTTGRGGFEVMTNSAQIDRARPV